MLPTMHRVAGRDNVVLSRPITGAEDFSYFARKVPGLFIFLGGKPVDTPAHKAAPHHTPDFFIDESSFKLGVRTMCNLTIDYMQKHK